MDKIRRKELQEKYKQMKPDMGIFIIRSKVSNKCYIRATNDLKGTMNGIQMRLSTGTIKNKEFQQDWTGLGADNFEISILERLEYDKDETKTDYTEELELLQMIWQERLSKDNKEFYKIL